METLRDRGEHRGFDVHPVEEDLLKVESKHGVAEQDEVGIVSQISAPVGGLMMLESIELNHQSIADEGVDRMSGEPDLLPDREPQPSDTRGEYGLETRVGEHRRQRRELTRARTSPTHP
jgi:hypothetical protein